MKVLPIEMKAKLIENAKIVIKDASNNRHTDLWHKDMQAAKNLRTYARMCY